MFSQYITPEKDKFFPLAKICRLCADTNGPFLNIFDESVNLDSKINELLPIMVNEMDDFPHKLCYMCSAKLQDFQNFVKKCMETQNSFHKSIGKTTPKSRDIIKIKENRETVRAKQVTSSSNKRLITMQEIKEQNERFTQDFGLKETERAKQVMSSSNKKLITMQEIKEENDRFTQDFGLKDLSIVLTRLEDEDPAEIKRRIEKQIKASMKPFFSTINVTGFGTIYTCNYCNEVFTQETIYTHKCKKRSMMIESQTAVQKTTNGKSIKCNSAKRVTPQSNESSNNLEPACKKLKISEYEYPCITVKNVDMHLGRLTKNLINFFEIEGKGV